MMRRSMIMAALLSTLLPATAIAVEGEDLLGLWETSGDDRAWVEFTRDGEVYSGRIVKLLQPRFPEDDPTHPGEIKVDRLRFVSPNTLLSGKRPTVTDPNTQRESYQLVAYPAPVPDAEGFVDDLTVVVDNGVGGWG